MTPKPNTINERIALRHGVPRDSEIDRILALPRRIWNEAQVRRAATKLTAELRRKRGTQVLWDDQAIALWEIRKYRKLAGGIKVSGGKTLISFLAPSVLSDLPRPLILCPSKSIKAGKVAAAYKAARAHWKVRKDIAWLSYELLQRREYAEYLETYQPKLLILDEAHWAGRHNSSRTKRISRYLKAHPDVVCIVLSGSLIASRVVNDSLRLCHWALRKGSPLPRPQHKQSARYWRLALEHPPRAKPGALRAFCKPDEPTLEGVGRRYRQTPGLVCSSGNSNIGASFVAETEVVNITDQRILDAVGNVRAGRLPDGSELLDPDGANTWSTVQTLALGFYYVPDPPPPAPWLRAYRNWCSYCREVVADESNTLDTERQVVDSLGDAECWPWTEWLQVRDSYKLVRKAVWVSDVRVRAAEAWARTHKHGIVWTQYKAFGQALRLPYYGSQARDRNTRRYITQHKRGLPCAASIRVCSEDLDLQHTFYENLVVCPPASGSWHEQLNARTHRFGQPEGTVTTRYWLACFENRRALAVARERELAASVLDGHSERKLLIAEWQQDKHKPLRGSPLWVGKRLPAELMR